MNQGSDKVLYHAISSYQLLEVLLHRRLFHPESWAALLLPDFIVEKYPQWQQLGTRGFFDVVRLFPYLEIPHGDSPQEAERIATQACSAYDSLGLPPLEEFSKRYVAGAQFYFTLALLKRGQPFSFFEDAAGALSRPQREAGILAAKFPVHAAIAQERGLFSGRNPLIREAFCCGDAQTEQITLDCPLWDFSVERALQCLPHRWRRRVVRFFLPHPLHTQADTILLTQQLSNLGLLTQEEQLALYRSLWEGLLRGAKVLVKKHPDDPLDYRQALPGAQIVEEPFPAELLPYAFCGRKPRRVCGVNSAALANLGESFQVVRLGP
ncbi:MAG: polysialyltransferase family glycosyltransferase [Acutalibacter sp.]|jgi:hypothetical protein